MNEKDGFTTRGLMRGLASIARLLKREEFDQAREECRSLIVRANFGALAPDPGQHLLYFRNDDDRHLRRAVIDEFLRGKKVDDAELRDAVTYLCCRLSELSDSMAAQLRRPPSPPRPRPGLSPRLNRPRGIR